MTEQHFSHKERRFLVPHTFVDIVLRELERVLPQGRTYQVRTEYLDAPERTWSALTMNEEHPKIRFRTYDQRDTYLEKKLHSKGQTTKERIPVSQKPEGLIVVGTMIYNRTEYELDGTRVTIDRNVKGSEQPMPVQQMPTLGFLLVEVKGAMKDELRIMRPFECDKFGKWKWITGKWKYE